MEIQKLRQSLARHLQQHQDLGSIPRQLAITELRQRLDEVIARRDFHNAGATAEHDFYTSSVQQAVPRYQELCSQFDRLMAGDQDVSLDEFESRLSAFHFEIASDYQQDKSYPHWGMSPQPGETYFMSKITVYVHIIILANLGVKGQQNVRRTRFYLRDQQCAGSKDCNDTVCTLFEGLSHRWTPICPQPKLYRSGYSVTEVSSTAHTLLTAQDMSKGMGAAG